VAGAVVASVALVPVGSLLSAAQAATSSIIRTTGATERGVMVMGAF